MDINNTQILIKRNKTLVVSFFPNNIEMNIIVVLLKKRDTRDLFRNEFFINK